MKKMKLFWAFLILLLLLCPVGIAHAKGKTSLNPAKLTITQGNTKTIKLKNNRKKVTWSVVSGKTNIALKNKKKTGVQVIAKKQGTAKVQAKIGKQKYICKVTVKRKQEKTVDVIVNGKKFQAKLADTAAAKELAKKLPMTINMKELNGNEKYCYLSFDLPANETPSGDTSMPFGKNDENVSGQIRTGDIMLYGSDCLVFFYKNFRTSYQYTRIGRITDPEGFASALGKGNVQVMIQAR